MTDIDNTKYELNDYQKKRLENIKRNNARLRSLGLISALEERQSNAMAEGFSLNHSSTDAVEKETKKRGKRKTIDSGCQSNQQEVDVTEESGAKRRKSLRLQGIRADFQTSDTHTVMQQGEGREALDDLHAQIQSEREARVRECREVRLRAAKAVAECGAEKAAKENPTASYEHCLMRVRSMTEKGLLNRVKAIERAAGKHCVVKMAIFKSCLQDEGLWDLAEKASEALERLKALQPFPES